MKTVNANEYNRDVPDAALRQRIEEHAYRVWLESGRGHGDHERHWLQAEREVMEETAHERKPQSNTRERKKAAKSH